jgi:AcrR family transcriptional regulator
MVYPSKIDRRIVIDAALSLVEREGGEALTLRRLAGELRVSANALYRYFESRDVLVAATADAIAQRLYDAIEEGMTDMAHGATIEDRVRKLLTVYTAFADGNPALYGTFLSADQEAGEHLPEPRYHEWLWGQALAIVEPLVGAADGPAATVSMWGMVHGMWALRQAGVLGGKKPAEIDDYAFDAIIRGLGRRLSSDS